MRDLCLGQHRAPAALSPADPRCGEALVGALGDQGALELGDRREDVEGELPGRGGGVDALVQHAEVDAAAFEVGGQFDEVGDDRPSRSSFVMTTTSPGRT